MVRDVWDCLREVDSWEMGVGCYRWGYSFVDFGYRYTKAPPAAINTIDFPLS